MKTSFLFRPFLLISFLANTLFSNETYSQGSPIGCNGQFFVSHGTNNTNTSATSLKQLSFSGSQITAANFALNNTNIGFNAIGINPVDGYMYGIQYSTGSNKGNLVKVGAGANNIATLSAISNGAIANGDKAYAGCFDNDGTYFFTTDANELFRMSGLNSSPISYTVTQVGGTIASNGFLVDIAIDPTDGQMYGVSLNYVLYKINKTNGTLTTVGTHAGTNYIAGLFFDEVGKLYGYRQDGTFHQINKTNAVLTQIGTTATYTYADGCGCSNGRVYHELRSSPRQICPFPNNPYFEWNMAVDMTNATPAQKTGLTFTLDIPSNRFSFIESPDVIAQRLFDSSLLNTNSASQVVIGNGTTPGTNNKIVITGLKTGGPGVMKTFTLRLKLVTLGGTYTAVPMQSVLSGLPALIGSTDNSNDPNTLAPDDATVLDFCSGITSLPVDLISFSGSYKNGFTSLNWVTENETNFSHYELERSADGTRFSNIASKMSTGGTGRHNYQHQDDLLNTSGNVFYYRLKMVDVDGKAKYSNVILIRRDVKGLSGISIIPNPVMTGAGQASIQFESASNNFVQIRVIDASGRTLLIQNNTVVKGVNSIQLNQIQKLTPGMYLIQLQQGTELSSTRLVVTK